MEKGLSESQLQIIKDHTDLKTVGKYAKTEISTICDQHCPGTVNSGQLLESHHILYRSTLSIPFRQILVKVT
jgi:hypothetical protein